MIVTRTRAAWATMRPFAALLAVCLLPALVVVLVGVLVRAF